MKKLTELNTNTISVVNSFSNKMDAKKLITMGVLPNREIEILRKSPFNGAFYIRVAKLFFAIRKEEAENIIVE